jgi:hypothetical protein
VVVAQLEPGLIDHERGALEAARQLAQLRERHRRTGRTAGRAQAHDVRLLELDQLADLLEVDAMPGALDRAPARDARGVLARRCRELGVTRLDRQEHRARGQERLRAAPHQLARAVTQQHLLRIEPEALGDRASRARSLRIRMAIEQRRGRCFRDALGHGVRVLSRAQVEHIARVEPELRQPFG